MNGSRDHAVCHRKTPRQTKLDKPASGIIGTHGVFTSENMLENMEYWGNANGWYVMLIQTPDTTEKDRDSRGMASEKALTMTHLII